LSSAEYTSLESTRMLTTNGCVFRYRLIVSSGKSASATERSLVARFVRLAATRRLRGDDDDDDDGEDDIVT